MSSGKNVFTVFFSHRNICFSDDCFAFLVMSFEASCARYWQCVYRTLSFVDGFRTVGSSYFLPRILGL